MSTGERIDSRKGAARTYGPKLISSKLMPWALAAAVLFTSMPAQSFLARPAVFAGLGNVTKAPSGWLQLCAEKPEECRPSADAPREVTLTPDLLQQLYSINGYVNKRVTWTSDAELYGKAERWTLPLDRGDCEDMVLLKRRLLADAGWPISALLITIVEDRKAGRHAVLTVHTDRGEMVLDNQTPEILFWYETSYQYLARQSPADPNVWVSFTEQPKPTVASATR